MNRGIGIFGAHRTGKTTLALALSDFTGRPFIKTGATNVFKSFGLNPSDKLDFSTRLQVQEAILEEFTTQWCSATEPFVTDRTPIDLLMYTFADIVGDTDVVDFDRLIEYKMRCFDVVSECFEGMMLLQPAIDLVAEEGKAALNKGYLEHLNTLGLGLVTDDLMTSNCDVFVMDRSKVDLGERVQECCTLFYI